MLAIKPSTSTASVLDQLWTLSCAVKSLAMESSELDAPDAHAIRDALERIAGELQALQVDFAKLHTRD